MLHRLEAPCVMLEGAHFLTRERGPEVSQLLRHIILHGAALGYCLAVGTLPGGPSESAMQLLALPCWWHVARESKPEPDILDLRR